MSQLSAVLKSRCYPTTKKKLGKYIEKENKKGNAVNESDVIRNAVIAFLDAEDAKDARSEASKILDSTVRSASRP